MKTHAAKRRPRASGYGRLKIIGILAVVVLGATLFAIFRPHPFVDQSENLRLDQIPGVSADALSKKNITYRIIEPVTYYKSGGLAIFDVEILAPGFSQRNLSFTGDGERFNGFVAELDFVDENAGRFKIGQAGSGAVDGITSLVTGLWGLVQHPIDSAEGIGGGAVQLKNYVYNISTGNADPINDIKNLASSLYINTASEIATNGHFSYQEAVTDEARDTVNAMTNWKLSGRGLTEVGLLLVPISKITALKTSAEVADIAKGAVALESSEEIGEVSRGYESILKGGKLFSQSENILNSLRRMARFATAERKIADQILRALTDPEKLSSLGIRGANTRVHKLLYHLYDVEKNGENVAQALDRTLVPGMKGEFYYSQPLVKRQILENYSHAKELGIFDNPANLDKMRRGISPIIQRGPYAGKAVDVDHIIPIKQAPELSNNLANLRYLSSTENASRGASIDADALRLMQDMKSAGWTPSSDLQAVAANK